MARVVIAEPQPIIRSALCRLLAEAGHEVQGETADGRDAVVLVQSGSPDLLILELELPRLGGLELIQRLHNRQKKTRILVFTALPGAYYQRLCLQAGANGFLAKDASLQEIDDAIRLTLAGKQVLSLAPETVAVPGEQDDERFSPRELTVLQYLAQGFRVKDIAHELSLSDRTVSTYKARLLEKTRTASVVDLIEESRVRGLLGEGMIARMETAPTSGPNPAHLAELFGILPTAVCLRDAEGRLLECNQQFLDIHGKTLEALRGTMIFQSGFVEPGIAEQARLEYRAGSASLRPFSLVVPVNIQGQRRILRMIGTPLLDAAGALTGVICSHVDITEHERQVERLQESKANLESLRATRAAVLLSSGKENLAHLDELGRLLPAIAGEELRARALHLLALVRGQIDTVLDVVRFEQGSAILVPQSMELNALTQKALDDAAPAVPFHPTPAAMRAWIDPTRYRLLVSCLLTFLARAGLADLQLEAMAHPLLHGELSWRLTFRTARGQDLPQRLADQEHQAHLQLAHHLARALGGELRLGDPAQDDVAALIQIKLARG